VSHVLNGQVERFSDDTVERVRSAAVELGYVRSGAGRALVMGRSDFIVLVVPHATITRLQDVVEVLSADIEEFGFTVIVHFNGAHAESETPSRLHHMIEELRPAGVVDLGGLFPRDLDFMGRVGCPVIPQEAPADANQWIGHLQARHLRSRGYMKIAYAFLLEPRDDPFGQGRAGAVAEFCAAEGLAPPTRIHVPLDTEGARRALERLLALRGRPVGIACYNDEVAIALVFAAKGLALAVPGDVAVVGVERTNVGQLVSPRLTTVAADVPAAVRHIRHALAQSYGSANAAPGVPTPEEAYAILIGETT
jgi:DNA-binding LacI/PurR family transcriptional regulator